jgi:hypothetical protein
MKSFLKEFFNLRSFVYKIKNSEFLTFNEVLKMKVKIVNWFLIVFLALTITVVPENNITRNLLLLLAPSAIMLLVSFLLVRFKISRVAMHTTIYTFLLLTGYYLTSSDYFFTYMLFFVGLTIIIFYQDFMTYLLYGGALMIAGVYYVIVEGSSLVGQNSVSAASSSYVSSLTYQVILIGFYIVFFVQFIVSDNIYARLNNEWVRMSKSLERYQEFTHSHLVELIDKSEKEAIFKSSKFQQTVSEIAVFMNEFFEDNGDEIAEVVEFYFFIHGKEIDLVIEDQELPVITRKYALELKKYMLNYRSEIVSILFDFSTLLQDEEPYDENRYVYDLNKLFNNRINKLLSLAILYKYLKSEITQFDKWGQISKTLNHEEITQLFLSPKFRDFISFEQVNFYLDNQELFKEYL